MFYGDGTRVDLLRTAGAETAEAILFCQDGTDLDHERLQPILEAFPHTVVLVRAFDRRHVMALDRSDIVGTYRDVFETAVVMARDALTALGVPQRDVARIEREYRRRDDNRLAQQSATGDLHAAKESVFTEDSPMEEHADALPPSKTDD